MLKINKRLDNDNLIIMTRYDSQFNEMKKSLEIYKEEVKEEFVFDRLNVRNDVK